LLISGLCLLITATLSASPVLAEFDPTFLISDAEFEDATSMTVGQVQEFLDDRSGCLSNKALHETFAFSYEASACLYDYVLSNGELARSASPAEVIALSASDPGQPCAPGQNWINPKVLLATIQKETSLIDKPSNCTQSVLDKATGYSWFDRGGSNPKYKGLFNQVIATAFTLTQKYEGFKKKPVQDAITIDGMTFVPANAATAALYTYTPHVHGNENFVAIYEGYFGSGSPKRNREDLSACVVSGTGVTFIEETDGCVEQGGEHWWDADGSGGHSFYTYTTSADASDSYLKWYLDFPEAGDYEFEVLVPGISNLSKKASYKFWLPGEHWVTIDQAEHANGWASLGVFTVVEGSDKALRLNDNTGESYVGEGGTVLGFDALRITPSVGVGMDPNSIPVRTDDIGVEGGENSPSDSLETGAEEANSGCSALGSTNSPRGYGALLWLLVTGFFVVICRWRPGLSAFTVILPVLILGCAGASDNAVDAYAEKPIPEDEGFIVIGDKKMELVPAADQTWSDLPESYWAPTPVFGPDLPEKVNHAGYQTAVRDQVGQTCVDYAVVAGIEAVTYYESQKKVDISEAHLDAKSAAPTLEDTLLAAASTALTTEQYWPAGSTQPKDGWGNYQKYGIKTFHAIWDPTNIDALRAHLAEGNDVNVVLSLNCVQNAWKNTSKVEEPIAGKPGDWAHAVLLVGYEKILNGDNQERWFFRFKNSWGEEWGQGGYGWLSEDYIKKYVLQAAIVRTVLLPGESVVSCGDGVCSSGENCEDCLADCPCLPTQDCVLGQCVTSQQGCGDDKCNGSETKCSCPGDCGACTGCCSGTSCKSGTSNSACGKKGATCQACTGGDLCSSGYCGAECGDGECNGSETQCSCSADCGACTGCCNGSTCKSGTSSSACGKNGSACQTCAGGDLCKGGYCGADCGDAKCNGSETLCSCPVDCGSCSGCCSGSKCETGGSISACGKNGAACQTCLDGDLCSSGYCSAGCDDGLCNGTETKCSCPADCGACSGCCSDSTCMTGASNSACGKNGAACQTCLDGDLCSSGFCGTDCGDGQCNGAETKCSCPIDCGDCSGCCSGSICKAGTSNSACGKNALACQTCSGGELCSGGTCETVCNAENFWEPVVVSDTASAEGYVLGVQLGQGQDSDTGEPAPSLWIRVCKESGSFQFVVAMLMAETVKYYADPGVLVDTDLAEDPDNPGCTEWVKLGYTKNWTEGEKLGGWARVVSPSNCASSWDYECESPPAPGCGFCWRFDLSSMERTCLE